MSMVSPATIESLAKRRDGVTPNFVLEHVCAQCGMRCLCPDRYLTDSCKAMEYCEIMGWVPYSWTCTPCMAKMSDEDRAVYYEAHAVGVEEKAA